MPPPTVNGESDRSVREPLHATFEEAEGDQAGPLPYLRRQSSHPTRRNSSNHTDSTRRSLDAHSVDSLFVPRATSHTLEHEEPSLWHSAPLLFAIVPAIGGVAFQSGSVFITDMALLVLAAFYLNWCLVTPWVWYRSAQSVKLATPIENRQGPLQAAVEGMMQEADPIPVTSELAEDNAENKFPSAAPVATGEESHATKSAQQELRVHELAALALCFLGPLIGSFILHVIRQQLTTLGDQLVSNLHLTLFVLGAEIRPLRHGIRMAEARTLFLQRVVREDPHAGPKTGDHAMQSMQQRLDELEASLVDRLADASQRNNPANAVDSTESIKRMQVGIQSQIDALNRAVRRYEKRATAQTMQTEARFQALDTGLKDTISLAAAAATYSRQPGLLSIALEWVKMSIAIPLKLTYLVSVFPFQLIADFVVGLALKMGIVHGTMTLKPTIDDGKMTPRYKTVQITSGRRIQKRVE